MKIVAVMPVYGRHELTRLILRQWHYQLVRLRPAIDAHVVVVGSEGLRSAQLISGYNDTMSYRESPNLPLNRKWNMGLEVARFLKPDAVLVVGSDDLVSDSLWKAYAKKLQAGVPYFGLRDLYFFDAASLRLGHWPGYEASGQAHRAGEPVGLARCHARAALESVNWQLWPHEPARNTVLDLFSLKHLARVGFTPVTYTLAELKAKAVDIKVGHSITDFSRIPYDRVEQGHKAVDWLAALVDDAGLSELTTRWRKAA